MLHFYLGGRKDSNFESVWSIGHENGLDQGNGIIEKHKVQLMKKRKTDTCILEFCEAPYFAKGFCKRHYYHFEKCQPLVDYNKTESAPESDSDSTVDENGCWINQLEDGHQEERRESLFNIALKIDGYPYDVKEVGMKCGNDKCWNFHHLDFDKVENFTINPNYQRNK